MSDSPNKSNINIEVIAVAYKRFGELKTFVQSWLNQTSDQWKLKIIHDGLNEEFLQIMQKYQLEAPEKISFYCTESRFNDYGHSLRDLGLKEATENYVLLTNADNYFIPKAIEFLIEEIEKKDPDVVLFDMVHSHNEPGGRDLPPYSFFQTSYKRRCIDVSSAIVRTSLAKKAGFKHKSFDADANYFEDIKKLKPFFNLRVTKLPQILFVHN